jgi:hypothetical protein
MDPFTLVTGTTALLDVCLRGVGEIIKFTRSAAKVDIEIKNLSLEINALLELYRSLHGLCEPKRKAIPGPLVSEEETLWNLLIGNLKECDSAVLQLKGLLEGVAGGGGAAGNAKGYSNIFRKQFRLQSKGSDFTRIRQRLSGSQCCLQLLLTAINL